MKLLIAFLCALLITNHVQGQQFSAGVRTGASNWFALRDADEMLHAKNSITWDKALYTRYQSKKWFAAELEVANYSMNPAQWYNDVPLCDVGASEVIAEKYSYNTYEYTLNLQGQFSCPESKLQNYAGVSLSSIRNYERYDATLKSPVTSEVYKVSSTTPFIQSFFGLQHAVFYALNKHLAVNAVTSLKMNPFDIVDKQLNLPDTKFAFNIGIGYTF